MLLSEDQKRIVSWSRAGLWQWDVETGKTIGQEMVPHGVNLGAIFVGGDQRVLSWTDLSKIYLWDLKSNEAIGPVHSHDEIVFGATSIDDRTILSWSLDGTLREWDVGWPAGNLLEIGCDLLPDRNLGSIYRRYGIRIDEPVCASDAKIPVPDQTERTTSELRPPTVSGAIREWWKSTRYKLGSLFGYSTVTSH